MALSDLPLSYCTNVHPGRSVAEVEAGLTRYTAVVSKAWGEPLSAGLWLARSVLDELVEADDVLVRFARGLRERGLSCHTLNAFPFGDFHSERVKEQVYVPDWSDPRRLRYTSECAAVLVELLGETDEGSISTVPLGFKAFDRGPGFVDECIQMLLALAGSLDEKRRESGKTIRLAIEPEPLCVLETTDEAIAFFRRLRDAAARAGMSEITDRHMGLCYDVCHQAVEFEDVGASIRAIDRAGIRMNKLHISCAIEIDRPSDNAAGRAALARYVEPRYLHQTIARSADGTLARMQDLTANFILDPPPEFRDASTWRVHFHVPVDAERLGPLRTTRPALRQALEAVRGLSYAPHLEVETYTWEVLPEPINLVEGLTRELSATRALLKDVAGHDGGSM